MRGIKKGVGYLLAGLLCAPVLADTYGWSSCQTITSVTDYTAYSSSFYLNLSPGVPGCTADTNGGVLYRIGAAGVTSDSYKNLIASTLFAMAMGKQVMLYYDTTQAPACFVSVISIGGYANQCN
jgi:hypothetical protein